MARKITTLDEWNNLPVGTHAQVDAAPSREGVLHFIRVAEPILVVAGDYRLAGGMHWSSRWDQTYGATVPDTQNASVAARSVSEDARSTAQEEASQALVDRQTKLDAFDNMSMRDWKQLPADKKSVPTPAEVVIDRLLELGWQPPVQVPEGVQVWTVTGRPAEHPRSDGTMAYLSLPNGERWLEMQDRGDIWIEDPVITVINERPRKEV